MVAIIVTLLRVQAQSNGRDLMAHYAKLIDNIVVDVITVSNEVVGEYPESDAIGQAFIASLGIEGDWIQTSFNSNFRKQYAYANCTFDKLANVFISPQPFPSWTLDNNHDWQAPTPMPDNGKIYKWVESSLAWVEVVI